MFENAFGYDEKVPERIRTVVMWLSQDVASLQSKWDFYKKLFNNEQNTELLSELAAWSFNIIEESLRNDMTMAICRLSDPSKTFNKENLSLAYLVENCPEIPGLDAMLIDFQNSCEPVSKYRNKQVGHNDLSTVIKPRENPLPGINEEQINKVVKLASNLLNRVFSHFTKTELYFYTVSRDDADTLVFWLRAGKDSQSRA